MRKLSLSIFELLVIFCLLEGCQDKELAVVPSLPKIPCSASYSFGYTNKVSYYPGDVVKAYLQSIDNVPSCKLDIFKLTGELAFSVPTSLAVQKLIEKDPSVNGYGFFPTVEIELPLDLKSGIYLIEHQSPFVVKTRDPLDVLVIYPSNTANAYSYSGGKSLYSVENKPSFVSFLRPIPIPRLAEFGLKWFSTLQNVNVGFATDIDMDDYAAIRNAKILVIVGHSEYWTRRGREHFDKFVLEGGNALVLSGNTMWWQVRYSANYDKLIRYYGNDPEPNPLLKTINWSERSLQYSIVSSIGADFPHGGYGLKTDNGWDGYKIMSPDSPLLEGTGFRKGDIMSLPSGEYDGAPIKGFDNDQFPILDLDSLQFSKIELIGFDKGSRFDKETIGTFIVFKRTETSGIVVNGASYDWCSLKGMGGQDGDKIQRITRNAIDKLLNGKPIFSK